MEIIISTLFLCFISYTFFKMLVSITDRKSSINLEDFNDSYYLDIEDNFNNYYLRRVKIMRYFSQEENFNRLKVILDKENGIIEKIENLFRDNEKIGQEYTILKNKLGDEFFNISPYIFYDIEINDHNFRTSLGQLNVIAWLFYNDYMLYIN